MKVLLLSEADFALVKRKVSEEVHCAETNVMLMQAWERDRRCKWHARGFLRKRRLEAHRLARILRQA